MYSFSLNCIYYMSSLNKELKKSMTVKSYRRSLFPRIVEANADNLDNVEVSFMELKCDGTLKLISTKSNKLYILQN